MMMLNLKTFLMEGQIMKSSQTSSLRLFVLSSKKAFWRPLGHITVGRVGVSFALLEGGGGLDRASLRLRDEIQKRPQHDA